MTPRTHAEPTLRSLHAGLLALVALGTFATACGDDQVTIGEDVVGNEGSEPGSAEPGEGAAEPLYVIATSFSAGDETETYLVTTDSFDESTQIDPTDGPKLLGGIVPTVRNGAVFAPDSGSPVISRFAPGADGRLVKGDEVSFAGVGMTEVLSWHVHVVNDEKAYVFDPAGPRIIVWNPTTMTLTGAQIDLPLLQRDGWVPNLVFEHSGPHARGNELLIPLGWQDIDGNSLFAAGLLVIDTNTDTVVDLDEDDRCGETYASVAAPNGDVYFFPPDWSAAPHYLADLHQPTCVLRVPVGATRFDDGFSLDLTQLGSGSAASGAVPDGAGGFFFTGLDEALWDGGNNEGGAVWRTYHYDFASGAARPVESLPVWAGQLYYVNVGGESFIPYWTETDTGDTTTLYRVNGGSDPTPLFSFGANWYGVARLR
jgi:hypothetical protein